jgi:hypothetical protein
MNTMLDMAKMNFVRDELLAADASFKVLREKQEDNYKIVRLFFQMHTGMFLDGDDDMVSLNRIDGFTAERRDLGEAVQCLLQLAWWREHQGTVNWSADEEIRVAQVERQRDLNMVRVYFSTLLGRDLSFRKEFVDSVTSRAYSS